MTEDEFQSNQSGSNLLNWIFGLAIALVAGGIAWVGWNFIDSVQKNAGQLSHYHATAENTKMQSQRFDIVNKELDQKIFSDQVDPEQALQEAVFKLKGSEITFAKGLSKIDGLEYRQGIENFSLVLQEIPVEARGKSSWRAHGCLMDKNLYTASAYQERSVCYLETAKYALAIADLTAAIKLHPDYAPNYRNRAKIYILIGDKKAGAADMKIAEALSRN